MKAQSEVLTQIQRQPTVLALPPRLIMLAILGGVLGIIPGSALDIAALTIFGPIIGFAGSWAFLFLGYRDNLHYDRDLTLSPVFWIGKDKPCQLIAGNKP